MQHTEKTTVEHWDEVWSTEPRLRLPSQLNVDIRNLQRLLRAHVRPRMRFLEVGCAPGKLLAWVAAVLRAETCGLDYSEQGVHFSRRLFDALGLAGDIRCEDFFATSFEPSSFDVVYSGGVIEHFDDPRDIVRRHVLLLRPGGTAVIAIPHYGGWYGALQRRLDPENLAIHNLEIMSPGTLESLAPADLVSSVRAYPVGRLSPWKLNLARRWPGSLARGVAHLVNAAGLLQPVEMAILCPMLVLELQRRSAS